jgi:hypothetical protein
VPVNKAHHVQTIALVAHELGEDEEWLHDISLGMDREDGLIWVYDIDDREVLAFTDDGVENLVQLISDLKRPPK